MCSNYTQYATNCLYVPLCRKFLLVFYTFLTAQTIPQIWGLESQNIPQIWGLESQKIPQIWGLEWVREIGVWNASVLGGSKKYPIFFIYNIPPKFGVFFGFPYPKFGVLFGLPYTKLRVFFGSLLSCAFHYLILFHPAPKPFHSQTGGLLPAFRFPFLVSWRYECHKY